MSERAPQTDGPAEQNRQKLETKSHSSEAEWKLLGLAKQAAEAKKNEQTDDYNVAVAAIKTRLDQLIASGEITQEGAKNRAEQIDKVIDNLTRGAGLQSLPVKQAERVSVRTGSSSEATSATSAAQSVESGPTSQSAEGDQPATPQAAEQQPAADTAAEQQGSGTEADPYTRPAPADLPTTKEVEAQKGKLSWRARARRALGLKANYAKHLLQTGGSFTAARQRFQVENDLTDADMAERRKKNGRLAVGVALAGIGITAAWRAYALTKGIETSMGGGQIDQPGDGTPSPENMPTTGGSGEHETSLQDIYSQSHDVNPFYDTDKLGIHNYGGPLDPSELDIKGVAGSGELIDNWKHNSGQMTVAAAEMGLPGFSDADTDPSQFGLEDANTMADNLNGDLDKYDMTYSQLMDILNKDTTTVQEIQLAPGTYGSYYQVDTGGELVNAYDPSVNEAGTGMQYTYQLDDGSWHQVIFKKECGGQVVHLHPAPVAPEVVATPAAEQPAMTSYAAPSAASAVETTVQPQHQPGSTPPAPHQPPETQPPVTQPPETQPPVTQPPVTQPPETQPPVTQPPETQPPVTQPPETLAPKDINSDDIGIWDAPKATTGTSQYDQLGDPQQNNTDPVVQQAPASEVSSEQIGGQASGAEQTTTVEQQAQQTTEAATGATSQTEPGTAEGSYFGESTSTSESTE